MGVGIPFLEVGTSLGDLQTDSAGVLEGSTFGSLTGTLPVPLVLNPDGRVVDRTSSLEGGTSLGEPEGVPPEVIVGSTLCSEVGMLLVLPGLGPLDRMEGTVSSREVENDPAGVVEVRTPYWEVGR